jgi:hypothetical protein
MTPHQRLALSFERYTDGRSLRRRNATPVETNAPSSGSEIESNEEEEHEEQETPVRIAPVLARQGDEFLVERVWAIRRLNNRLLEQIRKT